MTLRDDVRAALDGDETVALDAFGDLAPELVGTALGHFADTSTLADADALAPIVTAASPVPFDPLLDGVGPEPDGASVGEFDEDPDAFDRIDQSDESLDDPGVFDHVDDANVDEENPDAADHSLDAGVETDDAAFGAGDDSTDPTADLGGPFDEVALTDESFLGEADVFDAAIEDPFDEPAQDVAPIDPVDVDVDPADGDFDIID